MRNNFRGPHVADETWQAYYDGLLSRQEAARIVAHALTCPLCRQRGEQWEQLFQHIGELPDSAPLGDVAAPVLSRIRRQRLWHTVGWASVCIMLVPEVAIMFISASQLWDLVVAQHSVTSSLAKMAMSMGGRLLTSIVRLVIWLQNVPPLALSAWLTAMLLANFVLARLGVAVRKIVLEA